MGTCPKCKKVITKLIYVRTAWDDFYIEQDSATEQPVYDEQDCDRSGGVYECPECGKELTDDEQKAMDILGRQPKLGADG